MSTEQKQTIKADLVARLWDSDAASALTNEAAREIERLQAVLTQIATGRNAAGEFCDFPVDAAAEALGIVPSAWPARKVPKL